MRSWKYFDVSYSDDAATAPEVILEYREPRGGVEGFVRTEILKSKRNFYIEYTSKDVTITYKQSTLQDYKTMISNDQSTMNNIEINGHEGTSFLQEIPGGISTTIIWHDGQYAYRVCGNIAVDSLIQIAETIR